MWLMLHYLNAFPLSPWVEKLSSGGWTGSLGGGRVAGRERTVAEEGAGEELSRGTSRREPARRAGTKQRADSEGQSTCLSHLSQPRLPTGLCPSAPSSSTTPPAAPCRRTSSVDEDGGGPSISPPLYPLLAPGAPCNTNLVTSSWELCIYPGPAGTHSTSCSSPKGAVHCKQGRSLGFSP